MSAIKQCDRCKEAYDPYYDSYNISNYDDETWRYSVSKDCYPYPEKHKIDLCSECRKKLVRWLNNK